MVLIRKVIHTLRPGAVRSHVAKGNSQAHPGVSPLNPLTHRNVGYQPLPKPLGMPPYHYVLADNFPSMAAQISSAGKMVFHVIGDSGGIQDAQFQTDVAGQMVKSLAKGANIPQFCYHVGDVVYFTGAHDEYYSQFPAIMTAKWIMRPRRLRWMAGSLTSCKPLQTSIPFQKMLRAWV
jgi:hypothetical protein